MSTFHSLGENRPMGRLRWVYQRAHPLTQQSTIYDSILEIVTHTHIQIYKKDVYFGNVIARKKNKGTNNGIFIVLNPINY